MTKMRDKRRLESRRLEREIVSDFLLNKLLDSIQSWPRAVL
jgi:hypothetical protein